MWKQELWTPKTRFIISGVFLLLFIANLGNKNGGNNYKDGVGEIKHYTENDWDRNAMYRKMGEEVWEFSKNHPDAKELKLTIIDNCKDSKGKNTEYSSTILFNSKDIKDYSTYMDASSFNKNCYGFGAKMLDWHPCGNSPF